MLIARLAKTIACAMLGLSQAAGCSPGNLPASGEGIAALTQVTLVADHLGALQEQTCLTTYGAKGCAAYPNPAQCEALRLSVTQHAAVEGDCVVGGKSKAVRGFLQGVPLACAAGDGAGCVKCTDLYGREAFDSCNTAGSRHVATKGFTRPVSGSQPRALGLVGRTVTEDIQTVRPPTTDTDSTPGDGAQPIAEVAEPGQQSSQPPGPAAPPFASDEDKPSEESQRPASDPGAAAAAMTAPVQTQPTQTQPPTPTVDSAAVCIDHARRSFTAKLNQTLAENGLRFSIQLDGLPSPTDQHLLAWTQSKFDCGRATIDTECTRNALNQGRCYCSDGDDYLGLSGATCRCDRMTTVAGLHACRQRPPNCPATEADPYGQGILEAFVAATLWLNPGYGSNLVNTRLRLDQVQSPAELNCLGTPLVLDLSGDGLELTSAREGVDFDLVGVGRRRMSWVVGDDDALLAIDRNGNGRIDGGHELFGEGPSIAGTREADGFAALSWLDARRFGGNENGLVDPGDRMFSRLLLWHDRNHDGRSAAAELMPLAATDIVALSTRGQREAEKRLDAHGNDLGLRSYFLRQDGRHGALIDVYLTHR